MNRKNEFKPLYIVIVAIAWIADVFIVFSDRWDGEFPLIRILLLLFVFLPVLALLIMLAVRLRRALEGENRKKIIRGMVAAAAVLVLAVVGVVMVTKVMPARRGAHFVDQVNALLENGDEAAAAAQLNGRIDTRALQQAYAPVIRASQTLREGVFAVGSAVYYGRDYTSAQEDKLMRWYVIDREGDRALLFMAEPEFSAKGEYYMYWSFPDGGAKWATTSLREQMDADNASHTIRRIFSLAELEALQWTTIESLGYVESLDGRSGELKPLQTEDRLFPLSADEIIAYDLYAMSAEAGRTDLWGSSPWWTRTASGYNEMLCVTGAPEDADYTGAFTSRKTNYKWGVRLAMWVDIDAMLEAWAAE